tara:strand:- start:1658 stop:2353 length:696 start_codon:yes stop_codon:yes gene_type:complete
MENNQKIYDGWELEYFDLSKNFRKYQFSIINKFIKGTVAEIGPGNGVNILNYLDNCNSLDLFELNKDLFNNLNKNFGSLKKINIFNEIFDGDIEKYDSILYLDVLEHIQNDEKEILKALKLLKKNGNLIINVPAFKFLYSDFDSDVGHYRRYSKKDILRMADKFKLKISTIKYYDSIGFALSLLSKIFSSNYRKNFQTKIKFWDSLIIFSKIIDLITFNLVGKSLFIVIKK